MSEQFNDSDEAAQKAARTRKLRWIWIFLIIVFGVIILLNLYNWMNNDSNLTGILSPLTFIFLGLATIVGKEKKVLHYIFLGIAVISLLTSLALLIIY